MWPTFIAVTTSTIFFRYQSLDIAAMATIEHAGNEIVEADVTSMVTFTSSSPRAAVNADGVLSVVSSSGDASFAVGVTALVSDTPTQLVPMSAAVSEEQVRSSVLAMMLMLLVARQTLSALSCRVCHCMSTNVTQAAMRITF